MRGLRTNLLAAAALLAVATCAGPEAALATTTITSVNGAFTNKLVTATDTFTTAPAATSWVCFLGSDLRVQVYLVGGNGGYVQPLIERSDVDPSLDGSTAQPVSVLGEGTYPDTVGNTIAETFREPGRGWWRVRFTNNTPCTSGSIYCAQPGSMPTGVGTVNVSLSGKGC